MAMSAQVKIKLGTPLPTATFLRKTGDYAYAWCHTHEMTTITLVQVIFASALVGGARERERESFLCGQDRTCGTLFIF
jgi:hypothetical protein